MRTGRGVAIVAGALLLSGAVVWGVVASRAAPSLDGAVPEGPRTPFRLSADGELVRSHPEEPSVHDERGTEAPPVEAAPLWEQTPELARERRRLQDRVLSLRSPSSMGMLLQEVGLEVGRRASRCLAGQGWSLDRILEEDEKVLLVLDLADDGVHAAFRWVEPEVDPPAPAVRTCLAPLVDGLALPWQPEAGEVGAFLLLTPTLLTGEARE